MTPMLKQFLYSLVFLTDEVDEDGKPVPRKTFSKDVYRGCNGLRKAIVDSCEAGFIPDAADVKTAKMSDVIFKPAGETLEGHKIVLERFKDNDVDFTPQMKEAVTFYFKSLKELPALPEETLAELESIFGLKV